MIRTIRNNGNSTRYVQVATNVTILAPMGGFIGRNTTFRCNDLYRHTLRPISRHSHTSGHHKSKGRLSNTIKVLAFASPGITPIDKMGSLPDVGIDKADDDTNGDNKVPAPSMEVRWFFAVDVAKKKPAWMVVSDSEKSNKSDTFIEDKTVPKSFKAFSVRDSERLERGYQQRQREQQQRPAQENGTDIIDMDYTDIPVQEDHLFKVDLTTLELAPVYWDGPIYEVRRGTWFIKDGSSNIPCDAELAEELEENYLREKPYLNQNETHTSEEIEKNLTSFKLKTTGDNDKHVVYTHDGQGGWILSSTLYGTLTSKIMTSLTANIALGATKIVRGYPKPKQSLDKPQIVKSFSSRADNTESLNVKKTTERTTDASLLDRLSAKFSSPLETLMSAADISSSAASDHSDDIANDELDSPGAEIPESSAPQTDARNIDHLVLCVHGIGQRLGKRVESVNFVHDINIFRQKIKEVFTADANDDIHELLFPGLTEHRHHYAKELNKRSAKETIFQDVANMCVFTDTVANDNKPRTIKKNDCTVQVLPVLWRHHVDFNVTSQESHNTNDISLDDITITAIQPIRQLTGDLILDILLYYQPHYLDQILRASIRECNSIYRIFKERNPQFKGKVSIMGHSLGSAICFDILSNEYESLPLPSISQLGFEDKPSETHLEFDVDTYFAVGSPIGLFQLLKGNRIAARDQACAIFQGITPNAINSLARPKVRQFYNIYHPCDPVAYRVEPLVYHAASQLTSEQVPYTKFGFGNRELSNLSEKFTEGANWANSVWKNVLEDTENPLNIKQKQQISHNHNTDLNYTTELEQKNEKDEREKERIEAVRNDVSEKLRYLNQSGRMDYALQEGALEISVLAAIASHVSYFSDQDVANFLLRALYLNQETENGIVIGLNNEKRH